MVEGFTRILVVDDKDEIRCLVLKMLSRMGYEVISTDSGEKGLNLFRKNQLDPVITGFDMPGNVARQSEGGFGFGAIPLRYRAACCVEFH